MTDKYEHWKKGVPLTGRTDNIKVRGYEGLWYVIDTYNGFGPNLFLLESEEDGDECAHLIVDSEANPVWDGCYNDWDDLDDAVSDGTVMFVHHVNVIDRTAEWRIYREVGWKGSFG